MNFPRQPENLHGWQIDYQFLSEVKKLIRSKSGEKITLEAVEDVLIAVEKVLRARNAV